MNASMVSVILLISSVFTGLIVEAIKKMWNVDKPNILAAIVSVVVGLIVALSYVAVYSIEVNVTTVLFVFSNIVLSWLSAMLGYDKVVQTLAQLRR